MWIENENESTYYEPNTANAPSLIKMNWASSTKKTDYYIGLGDTIGATVTDGTRLTVQGRFVDSNTGNAAEIDTSILEWYVTNESDGTGKWILLPRLTELAEGTIANDSGWEIHMNYAGTLRYVDGETFPAKANVNGEEIEVTISTDGTNIIITPPADKVPADGTAVTMTLKAGDITGSKGSKSMIVNDVTFYFNQHGLSLNAPIPEVEEEYITSIYDIPATNKKAVYFKMSEVDAFGETIIVGEEADIKPFAMSGLKNGTFYHEAGLWLNDTWYGPNENEAVGHPGLVKSDAVRDGNQQDYYITLWHVQSQINDGTRIYLKGLFEDNGKYANIAESVMQWNVAEGEKEDSENGDWILLPRLLDMAKGAEKDGNQWKIYMNYVGTLAGKEGEVFTAIRNESRSLD